MVKSTLWKTLFGKEADKVGFKQASAVKEADKVGCKQASAVKEADKVGFKQASGDKVGFKEASAVAHSRIRANNSRRLGGLFSQYFTY